MVVQLSVAFNVTLDMEEVQQTEVWIRVKAAIDHDLIRTLVLLFLSIPIMCVYCMVWLKQLCFRDT